MLAALKAKGCVLRPIFQRICDQSSMYFRRTIARPRMAVAHHESAVLYPVRIRVIQASFFVLYPTRIIVNNFRIPLSVY